MQYLGDYAEDATLNFKFSTHKADGTPIALAGTPAISVYKANGTTQSTAGVTLTTDFDSVTGLNNVLIDLSADAFYAPGNDYSVVITTGTVNSVSVVGTVLAHFSIENRYELQTGDVYPVVAKETTLATVAGYLDTEIADIKAKTDLIPASPAAVGSAMTLTSDYPLKTDLATKAEIAAINEKIDTIDSNVDAILVDTGTTIPALINSDSGAGTIQHTYTLEAPVGTPCADARIYLSTDSLKANIIHEGITNALGQVTFNVDLPVGTTVYLWRYKTGVDFVNPDVEEI